MINYVPILVRLSSHQPSVANQQTVDIDLRCCRCLTRATDNKNNNKNL